MAKGTYETAETSSARKTSSNTAGTETAHDLTALFLFAAALIFVLSFFGLAGAVGSFLQRVLKLGLGGVAYVVPVVLLAFGYAILRHKRSLQLRHGIGLILLLLGMAGLFHWPIANSLMLEAAATGHGGGYIGYFIHRGLVPVIGVWGSVVLLIVVTLGGLILLFETSLKTILAQLVNLWSRIRPWFKLGKFALPKATEVFRSRETILPSQGSSFQVRTMAEVVPKVVTTLSSSGGVATQPKLIEMKSVRLPKTDVPLDLFEVRSGKATSGDIEANQEKIHRTLLNFGIEVEMGSVNVGPTVTQYTLKPSEGVKLASITALSNDLALALAAHPIRIEAPIPGQSLVGIEVPNQIVAMVSLRELLESSEFKHRGSNLTVALGKDVAGKPWVADIGRMPHLLVAGTTGSGKSVCINNIILSLLYTNSPDELKFIIVDPKRVELTAYNDVPHLLTPVITEVPKTINALKWVVGEMDRRYQVLAASGKRNIEAYNQMAEERLPYLMVVVDEFAGLMAVAAAEVETAIIRLAQMSRAVGIHLILATQRPSVDVITGLIKANISSRIAFNVASGTDSRTILDTSGAEKLLGRGDGLYISAELSKPKRLQGALVSDAEIERVTTYLKSQAKPDYNTEVVQKAGRGGGIGGSQDGDDDLLDEAQAEVVRTQKASASFLQRRLRVGYARAARLLDLLEERGVIGPGDGAKPRDVLISKDSIDTMEFETAGTEPVEPEAMAEDEIESEEQVEQLTKVAVEDEKQEEL